jgi:archaellum component FlaC
VIDYLNKIEGQVKDLETSIENQQGVSSRAVANRIVSQFFYDCQVAEDRIKEYGSWGYLTNKQIENLKTQLKNLVHRMTTLSKKSELLMDAILESYEAKILS